MKSFVKQRLASTALLALVVTVIGGGIFLQHSQVSPLTVLRAQGAASQPVSPANLKYRGYINDFAGVIDPESMQQLTRLATALDEKTRAQIAVVTIDTLGGEPVEDFATRLFQSWGIGHKDTKGATPACSRDCGLLLVLVVKDRKSRLEVGYGLEPIIPDGFSGSVLREMRPFLREQRYGPAIYQGCALLADRIATQAGAKLDDAYMPRGPYRRTGQQGPNWFVIVLIAAAILFGAPWWLALAGAGRWGGGGSGGSGFGGGFGGYDSGGGGGGGFGGFGGGSSGGGGASSSW